jgi:hypothetical protein
MKAKCTASLYYCETRWFSRTKLLHRVFELKEEIAHFLSDNNKIRQIYVRVKILFRN